VSEYKLNSNITSERSKQTAAIYQLKWENLPIQFLDGIFRAINDFSHKTVRLKRQTA